MTIKINVEHEPRTAVQRLDRASCLRVEGHPVAQAHSLDSFIPDQWLCPQLAVTPCWPLSRESSCHTLMAVCSVPSPSAFLIVPLSELSLFSLDTVVWVLPPWRHHCLYSKQQPQFSLPCIKRAFPQCTCLTLAFLLDRKFHEVQDEPSLLLRFTFLL